MRYVRTPEWRENATHDESEDQGYRRQRHFLGIYVKSQLDTKGAPNRRRNLLKTGPRHRRPELAANVGVSSRIIGVESGSKTPSRLSRNSGC